MLLHLGRHRGVAAKIAGTWVGLYWASLTAGRIVSGILATRIPAGTLLRISTIGAPVAAALVWSDIGVGLSLVGLATMGFVLAPIYPLLIAETPGRLGGSHATSAIGFQVAAAYLGAAGLPALAGVLASRNGLEVISPFLFWTSVTLVALHEFAGRSALDRVRAHPSTGHIPAA